MKSIEESVVTAMDGSNPLLFLYLPYILQDIWELGASPEIIINLVKKHKSNYTNLKILDLGCGKGAVSVKVAIELNCSCFGIDAIKEFIEVANLKAKEYGVDNLCKFKVGDIRTENLNEGKFDVIVLGAIGPILGNYEKTLTKLKCSLNNYGIIIIDDSYAEDKISNVDKNSQTKSSIIMDANKAGMKLLDEVIFPKNELKSSNEFIFLKLKKRCEELIIKEPRNKNLFEEYIQIQMNENYNLENNLVCSTLVFGKV